MSVFARIVIGVDGTELGFEALRQALSLAPADAPVDAVTALETGPAARTGFDAAYWTAQLEDEAEAARATASAMLEGRPGATAGVAGGRPVDVLRRARDEAGATLLALGGRRSSRLLGVMLGDTGTELLHDDACSVLLARPHPDGEWQPRDVVVGVDGSSWSLAALAAADELSGRLGSAVEVVSAADGGSPPSGPWAERVDVWEEGHPVRALVDRSARVDLVVVGSRGAHGVRALGSVSERVAHQARCSVLVVHEPAAGR
ncbi:MAG TPA: universal stress protein [Gaiellaceae bacterium]|jgi:nucleotide-binding universal stress UspA family protein